MKSLNLKKGITLIALIITIIVLLILAGITINLTIGQGGILKRAEEAGENYVDAAENERNQLAELTNTTDNIIANVTGNNMNITPTIDVSKLNAGDYIKYDSGEKGVIMCRVLYPVSSEYGLQIISDKKVQDVRLGTAETWASGKKAYNELIVNLNNYAEAYINEEYAFDARCVGSLPTTQNGIFVDKDKSNAEEGTVSIPETWSIPSGWETRDTGCYKEDTNYTIDQTQMKANNLWNIGQSYWVPSRRITGSTERYFSVRYANGDSLPSAYLCTVSSTGILSGYKPTMGLRPCISLKSSEIKIISGNGETSDTAYEIGKR